MSKKKTWVKVIAVASAVVGGAVALAAYLKNKSKRLSEELDFDNSLYFDEDPATMDEETYEETEEASTEESMEDEETAVEENDAEETTAVEDPSYE